MSLKITVDVAQKLGTSGYGNVAANCGVEFKAVAGLLQGDLAGFHQQVGRA